jgi:hypothetical protein
MYLFDRYLGILFAVFDEDDASVRLERLMDMGHNFEGLGEFVIDIHHQDQIDASRWQSGIHLGASHLSHIRNPQSLRATTDGFKHLVLDLDGQHLTSPANFGRDAKGEVTRPSTKVHNHLTLPKVQSVNYYFRSLFVFAFRTIQPSNPTGTHYLSDFATHVEFSDTIWVMYRAHFVDRMGRRTGDRNSRRLRDRVSSSIPPLRSL